MTFDSAFFLFCFFPILFLIYFPVKSIRARNGLMLAAGLLLCAFGRLFDLLVLLLMAAGTWGAGELIRRDRGAKGALLGALALDLGLLAGFKALQRVTVTLTGPDTVLRLLFAQASPAVLAAPLGVSFFAFKCVAYAADVYRDREGAGSFGSFLLYASFLPELTSGPISRYRDFAPQLRDRQVTLEGAAEGLCRLIRGLGKKVLLAGAAGAVADAVFGFDGTPDIRLAWVGALAYTVQIFFDFSGYSDMAIGLAQVFGFTSPENFNFPYTASSLRDFWRRWHMSLSGWFRDYVYIPLGGNRRGEVRTALNKFIVFTLCGVWHGFGWTFLLWGLWHGVLSALESLKILDIPRWREHKVGIVLSHVYTLLAVVLGFVMFRAETAGQGFTLLGAMFAGFRFTAAGTALLLRVLNARNLFLLALGAVLCLPAAEALKNRLTGKWVPVLRYAGYAVLFALCLTGLAAGGFSPFIYAQF